MEQTEGTDRAPARSRVDVADVDTVAGIARRESPALAEAYERHAKAVFEVARGVLGQRLLAEEVVQDVFVTLWDRPERFDPQRGSLRTYLLTVAHGRSVDVARSESARHRREEKETRLAGRGDASQPVQRDLDVAHDVRDALLELGHDEREAITLAYFFGYSYREVAAKLGVPEGTIKNRIRKGLSRLRDRLETPDPVGAV